MYVGVCVGAPMSCVFASLPLTGTPPVHHQDSQSSPAIPHNFVPLGPAGKYDVPCCMLSLCYALLSSVCECVCACACVCACMAHTYRSGNIYCMASSPRCHTLLQAHPLALSPLAPTPRLGCKTAPARHPACKTTLAHHLACKAMPACHLVYSSSPLPSRLPPPRE